MIFCDCPGLQQHATTLRRMTTFVIVHGAWGGGWEWSPVADILRRHGHRAFTPTLTGMGERAHLSQGEAVGLGTHIDDIVAVLEFERLRDVVLCGASYGGLPATGAADHAADRVRLLVYIDGLVPVPGRPAIDQFPASFADMIRDGIAEHGSAWRVPLPAGFFDALIPAGSVPEAFRQDYARRAGVEGTISQGVRAFGLRQARYLGLAKTHLQELGTAVAINLCRWSAWHRHKPRAKTRTSRLAALALVA